MWQDFINEFRTIGSARFSFCIKRLSLDGHTENFFFPNLFSYVFSHGREAWPNASCMSATPFPSLKDSPSTTPLKPAQPYARALGLTLPSHWSVTFLAISLFSNRTEDPLKLMAELFRQLYEKSFTCTVDASAQLYGSCNNFINNVVL